MAKRVKHHGVVVVHGQGDGQVPGGMLAAVVNPIADELENAGGRVDRWFAVEGERAEASLAVTSPAGTVERFRFVEAFWAAAFPPAPPEVVARWILKRGPRELAKITTGWWSNPANDRRDDGEQSDFPSHPLVKAAFVVELALISAAFWVVYALSLPIGLALFALYALAATPVFKELKLDRVAGALRKAVDPFFGAVLGDTWRFVEDGMWSINIRRRVEDEAIALYADPEIDDVAVIAYSEGGAVAYDALAEGSRVGVAAAASPKRLTLATVGSGVNRNYGLAKQSTTSPYTRRLSERPLDHRITGVPPAGAIVPAVTPEAKAALRARFFWLDVYARLDYVPGGPVLPEVQALARIDPCQIKLRKVINDDDLVGDHGGYFANKDLVVPRLIRAIYGGEYPWTGPDRKSSPAITGDRVRSRNRRVVGLQLARLVTVAAAAAMLAFLAWSEGWRDGTTRFLDLAVTAGKGEVPDAVAVPLVAVAAILSAPAVYRLLRVWAVEE